MATDTLVILGKSEATITMILDNLDSQKSYPVIQIINNLGLPVLKPYEHQGFKIALCETFETIGAEHVVLGAFQSDAKQKVHEAFALDINRYRTLIHATASVSATTQLNSGCLINSLVSIAAQSYLGHCVSVNRNASIGHHTTLHDFVTINPGCNIAGNVTIGRGAQIGMGANILDGLTIGENTIIGAGSVVTRSIPANVVAIGCPARVVRERI